jgi:hypothetical protein
MKRKTYYVILASINDGGTFSQATTFVPQGGILPSKEKAIKFIEKHGKKYDYIIYQSVR